MTTTAEHWFNNITAFAGLDSSSWLRIYKSLAPKHPKGDGPRNPGGPSATVPAGPSLDHAEEGGDSPLEPSYLTAQRSLAQSMPAGPLALRDTASPAGSGKATRFLKPSGRSMLPAGAHGTPSKGALRADTSGPPHTNGSNPSCRSSGFRIPVQVEEIGVGLVGPIQGAPAGDRSGSPVPEPAFLITPAQPRPRRRRPLSPLQPVKACRGLFNKNAVSPPAPSGHDVDACEGNATEAQAQDVPDPLGGLPSVAPSDPECPPSMQEGPPVQRPRRKRRVKRAAAPKQAPSDVRVLPARWGNACPRAQDSCQLSDWVPVPINQGRVRKCTAAEPLKKRVRSVAARTVSGPQVPPAESRTASPRRPPSTRPAASGALRRAVPPPSQGAGRGKERRVEQAVRAEGLEAPRSPSPEEAGLGDQAIVVRPSPQPVSETPEEGGGSGSDADARPASSGSPAGAGSDTDTGASCDTDVALESAAGVRRPGAPAAAGAESRRLTLQDCRLAMEKKLQDPGTPTIGQAPKAAAKGRPGRKEGQKKKQRVVAQQDGNLGWEDVPEVPQRTLHTWPPGREPYRRLGIAVNLEDERDPNRMKEAEAVSRKFQDILRRVRHGVGTRSWDRWGAARGCTFGGQSDVPSQCE